MLGAVVRKQRGSMSYMDRRGETCVEEIYEYDFFW